MRPFRKTAAMAHKATGSKAWRTRFTFRHRGWPPPWVTCPATGFPTRARKQLQEPQALWRRLQRLHDEIDRVDNTRFGPLHLLLMGGDQIYSDDMRPAVPALRAW